MGVVEAAMDLKEEKVSRCFDLGMAVVKEAIYRLYEKTLVL